MIQIFLQIYDVDNHPGVFVSEPATGASTGQHPRAPRLQVPERHCCLPSPRLLLTQPGWSPHPRLRGCLFIHGFNYFLFQITFVLVYFTATHYSKCFSIASFTTWTKIDAQWGETINCIYWEDVLKRYANSSLETSRKCSFVEKFGIEEYSIMAEIAYFK